MGEKVIWIWKFGGKKSFKNGICEFSWRQMYFLESLLV